ncbi:MAG: hypothetical protein AABX77_01230 [Nanoarchaeota archaeon]
MIMIADPYKELQNKFKELEADVDKLEDLVEKGVISERLGEYAQRIAILDFAILEAFCHLRNGCYQKAAESLGEAKFYGLDPIAGLFFDVNSLKDYLKGSITTQDRELFKIAKQRYDEAYINIEVIMEK